MTTDNPITKNLATAYGEYRKAAAEAMKFHDPNYTNSAITRERARRLQAARAALAKALPSRASRDASNTKSRDAALGKLAVTNADTAAVASNEWTKVKSALDSGRNLGQLIASADQRRLMAILDHLDTDLVIGTGDEEGVRAEVTQAALTRLADLGDADATTALAAQNAEAHDRAWQSVVDEASRGEVSVRSRTALRRASVEEYDSAFPDTNEASDLNLAISHLDHIAPHLSEAVNGNAS